VVTAQWAFRSSAAGDGTAPPMLTTRFDPAVDLRNRATRQPALLLPRPRGTAGRAGQDRRAVGGGVLRRRGDVAAGRGPPSTAATGRRPCATRGAATPPCGRAPRTRTGTAWSRRSSGRTGSAEGQGLAASARAVAGLCPSWPPPGRRTTARGRSARPHPGATAQPVRRKRLRPGSRPM
jgi:hypothetical protein